MRKVFIAVLMLGLVTSASGQSRRVQGPVIDRYGPTFAVAEASFPLPSARPTKVVFDVARSPDGKGELNRSIETVARFLNMHVQAGIPLETLEVALVLHGGAGKDSLKNGAYRKRFEVDNPNLDLLSELRRVNVKIYLCGQTAGSRGFAADELAEPVDLALSAMTVLVGLQQQGYSLIAF